MKLIISLMMASLLITLPALGAESKASSEQTKQQETSKQSNTAKKAKGKPKSAWNKFTDSVKHGDNKPACNQQQHSLKQC